MKGLAAHLKYCYGACVKCNRNRTAEELSVKVHNILNYICGDHDNCDVSWCYNKKSIEQNLPYNPPPPPTHWLDKTAHPETYQQLKEHFNYYASVEMMQYCTHPYDTQTNEALNQSIANVAPKSMCYSGTTSLNSWIAITIGVHNLGLYPFFDALFCAAGIEMTSVLARFWHAKQK
jgi:hypothetical protein